MGEKKNGGKPAPSELLIRERLPFELAGGSRGSMTLLEAGTDGTDVFNEDGSVNVVLLRPCVGRGPAGVGGPAGRRIYTPEVLERDAGVFKGWSSFLNHDSPVARRARMNLPRGPDELAGEVQDSWWEPDIPVTPDDEKLGIKQGGVVGKFMPGTELVESLIRRIPNSLRWSIMGQATGLTKQSADDGGEGWLVEGIEDDPENSCFDVVTKAGAGGRVRSLIESLYDGSQTGDDDDDNGTEGELDMGGLTLQEALKSPEVKGYMGELVEAAVEEKLPEIQTAAEDKARAEVEDDVKAARWLRLSAKAHTLIEATKLPDAFKADLVEGYGVEDDGEHVVPGERLRLIEAVVEDGEVKKSAVKVLEEAIERDANRERAKLSEARPTVPITPSGGDGGGEGKPTFGGGDSAWAERARNLGLNPELAGAMKPPEQAATE